METNKIPSLGIYMALLGIMRNVYNRLTDPDDNMLPLIVEDSECEGISGRHLSCSYTFAPNSIEKDVHDLDLSIWSHNKDIDFSAKINIRIETKMNKVFIYIDWTAVELVQTIKEVVDSFLLDYDVCMKIEDRKQV